ncbi:hypothetical protein [Anaerobranca gottschalkii]|uniref:CRISPR-associated protein, APE2256 family n=1 Tax=Anaerobranca gottschalkii DSM 13577 TaxID=1120990 RepID=A0A1I0C226_9FIRM|nr:hypothetical protein [Anaerobranca gottschalkii]SET12923.1 CRISPR-associated protein, APE2256 family [Anaerobranca gottschalkii DSM 13577]
MEKETIIITSVGTSILDKYLRLKQNKNNHFKDKLNGLKTVPFEKLNERGSKINEIKEKITDYLQVEIDDGEYPSAEIKSLIKIKEQCNIKQKITAYLIATDSIACVLAAELIKEYFENRKEHNITVDFTREYFKEDSKKGNIVKGLLVNDKVRFENEGLLNLLGCILTKLEKKSKKNTLLNITGGYKALVPYFTVIGQVHSLPTFYIYEDTEEVIQVPQLPIEYDYSIVHENLFVFDDIKPEKSIKNLPTKDSFVENYSQELLDALLEKGMVRIIEDDKKVKASFIGGLIYQKYTREAYGENFSNLKGNLIELKLYKYFVEKRFPGAKIKHSYTKSGKDGKVDFEIDILVEDGDEILAVEIKAAGSVKVIEETDKNSIEYKLIQGGFYKLTELYPNKKHKREVYLYSNQQIYNRILKDIEKLHKDRPKETENLKWFHLKLDNTLDNYNVSEGKIKQIYPEKGE